MMFTEEGTRVADDTVSAHNAHELHVEVERSRESAARLLDSLSRTIGASRAVRHAASAAHYVQAHSVRDVATGIDRAVRKRPAASIAVAVVAGFLVGRAFRSR